jgi:hypothetical protein
MDQFVAWRDETILPCGVVVTLILFFMLCFFGS